MEQKILYKCDPKKNTECKKTFCKYIWEKGECEGTSEEKYAVHDDEGNPIIIANFKISGLNIT